MREGMGAWHCADKHVVRTLQVSSGRGAERDPFTWVWPHLQEWPVRKKHARIDLGSNICKISLVSAPASLVPRGSSFPKIPLKSQDWLSLVQFGSRARPGTKHDDQGWDEALIGQAFAMCPSPCKSHGGTWEQSAEGQVEGIVQGKVGMLLEETSWMLGG